MKLKNIMEDIVFTKIDEVIHSLGCCTCEYCKSDIAAYVLNHIKPKYVSTEKGALFSKLTETNVEADVEVLKAIIEAADVVKNHPRHPKI